MQFYLFFPILLLFLEKLKKPKLNIIVAVALISMFLSLDIKNKQGCKFLSNYLSNLGDYGRSNLLLLNAKEKKEYNKNYCESLSLLAIFLILISSFHLIKRLDTPGYFTLISIISTMILISYSQNTFFKKNIGK